MAYMDFGAAAFRPADSLEADDSQVGGFAGLGRDEWSVVEFARRDGLWSLWPNAILVRLARFLFGIQPPRPLANERLEALRRFAVVAWRKGSVGARQLRDFCAAGFSAADARRVLDHIGRRRSIQFSPRGLA